MVWHFCRVCYAKREPHKCIVAMPDGAMSPETCVLKGATSPEAKWRAMTKRTIKILLQDNILLLEKENRT